MRLPHLNRSPSHAKSLFKTQVSQLLTHQQITTTLPKAKATARLAERVISWGKRNNLATRRKLEGTLRPYLPLRDHLFHSLLPRYTHRVGGYTRIHRLGHRQSDHAPLAVLELVDGPNDLLRAFTLRIIARELAEAELGVGKNGGTERRRVDRAVWRNAVVEEEEAEKVVKGLEGLLPEPTKKRMAKVLSEAYVKTWDAGRRVKPMTPDEAAAANKERKRLQRDPTFLIGGTTLPTPSTSTTTTATSSGNTPTPTGPWTQFLYALRPLFHANLIELRKSDASQKTIVLPSELEAAEKAVSTPWNGRGLVARSRGVLQGTGKGKGREEKELPRHLKALRLGSLKQETVAEK